MLSHSFLFLNIVESIFFVPKILKNPFNSNTILQLHVIPTTKQFNRSS